MNSPVRSPLAPVLAALGDDTRWAVLTALGDGEASASALAQRLPVSRQAIAKHLAVLQGAGLVEAVPAGREVRYRPLGAELVRAGRALERLGTAWEQRLAALKAAVENQPQ